MNSGELIWSSDVQFYFNFSCLLLYNVKLETVNVLQWGIFIYSLCVCCRVRNFSLLIKQNNHDCSVITEVIIIIFFKINLFYFIYFWLRWVFVAACGLSLVAVSGSNSWLRCTGFSLLWLLLLGAGALGTWASVVVARGLSGCGSWD